MVLVNMPGGEIREESIVTWIFSLKGSQFSVGMTLEKQCDDEFEEIKDEESRSYGIYRLKPKYSASVKRITLQIAGKFQEKILQSLSAIEVTVRVGEALKFLMRPEKVHLLDSFFLAECLLDAKLFTIRDDYLKTLLYLSNSPVFTLHAYVPQELERRVDIRVVIVAVLSKSVCKG
jgi:hypothetical protein